VPWWWDTDGEVRRRRAQLVQDGETYDLTTVDHGRVVSYAGESPVATAKNGVLRTGTHAQFGFGEFRVRPADGDRVPERPDTDESTADQRGVL
jgi:hypothetical protein